MSWISVSIESDCQHADALADALIEAGAITASIEDADAETENETPQFGEPGSSATPGWERSRVLALFQEGDDLAPIVAECARHAGLAAPPPYRCEILADQNFFFRL